MTPGSAVSLFPSFLSVPLSLCFSISEHLNVQLLFATWPLFLLPLRRAYTLHLLSSSSLSFRAPTRSLARDAAIIASILG